MKGRSTPPRIIANRLLSTNRAMMTMMTVIEVVHDRTVYWLSDNI